MRPNLPDAYPSLGARVIHSFVALYPPFVFRPGWGDEEAQRQIHGFLLQMLERCEAEPERLGIKPQPDDCFPSRHLLNKTNPALAKAFNDVRKKILDAIGLLDELGLAGEAAGAELAVPKQARAITPRQRQRLEAMGLTCREAGDCAYLSAPGWPQLPAGWRGRCLNLARDTWKTWKPWIQCSFLMGYTPGQPYRMVDLFGKLYRDPAPLAAMEDFFQAHGYILDTDAMNQWMGWERSYPDGDRGYFRLEYRYRDREQVCYQFRLPHFAKILEDVAQLDAPTRALCLAASKDCDGCGYCTQTDRSGRRPRQTVEVSVDGAEYRKCPIFPRFSWNQPTEELLARVRALFERGEGYVR